MPDVVLSDYELSPVDNGGRLTPGMPNTSGTPTSADATLNEALNKLMKEAPIWNKSERLNTPFESPLSEALRYNKPKIGFHPFDDELEHKYAAAYPLKTFGNNLLQFGARFLGAATEAIMTIPIALSGRSPYDNPVTTDINDWLESLSTSLPTYRSEYEDNHPLLKYLTIWKPTSFLGAWGGAINNFGYTAGAFAGSWLTFAPFGLIGNAFKLTRLFGRYGRAVATDATAVGNEAKAVIAAGERKLLTQGERGVVVANTERGVVSPGGGMAGKSQLGRDYVLAEGEGMASQALPNVGKNIAAESVHTLDKATDFLNGVAKVRDWTKYNLSLLTAATAEGSFEANTVMKHGREQLAQQFFDQYGRSPEGEEIREIESIVKETADFTMASNIALLYFSNRIIWGSVFKPGKAATQAVVDKSFANVSKNVLKQDAKTGLYGVVKTVPETKLEKLLLTLTKPGRALAANINESAEEASQFIISEGSLDYASRKFDAESRGEVADYMKSFYTGLNKTFKTNEGWDNIIGGFVGGMLGGGVRSRIERSRGVVNNPLKRLQQQAKLMNEGARLNGLFEHKVQEAAINNSLGKDYKKAVEKGDTFKALSLKQDMLFNYVSSAMKANRFDMRIDELEAAKNLTGEEFEKMWGQGYSDTIGQSAAEYLDTVIEKAKAVKKDIDKVNRLWRSNPFNPKTQSADYIKYDSYKDELARNLSMSREYQKRMKNVESDLKTLLPGIDVQRALEMTSLQGMRTMLTRLQTSMNELGKQIGQSQGNDILVDDLVSKRAKLKELFDELQPQVLNGFEATTFVTTLEKLYKFYSGIDDTNNNFIEDRKRIGEANTIYLEANNNEKKSSDELADALEQLQDIRKLAGANFGALRFYNYLQTDVGHLDYEDKMGELIQANLDKIVTDDNGRTLTSEEFENLMEEESRFETGIHTDVEDTDSSEERETLRQAAKKYVNGEELSDEEKAASEAKPKYFTKEVKIQVVTKEKISKRTGKDAKNTPQDAKKTAMDGFNGIHPLHNVFGLHSQDKNDVKFRTNLYNALFKSPVNQIFKNIKAAFKSPDPQEITYTLIPGTSLYRKTFTENVIITKNDEQIGILRPASSVWLDAEGKRSIYDMTEDEYESVTKNNKSTYAAFMSAIKAYRTQYNNMMEAMEDGTTTLSLDQIETYFNLANNFGSTIHNRYTIKQVGAKFNILDPQGRIVKTTDSNAAAEDWREANRKNLARYDVTIKELEYKPQGTALISMIEKTNIGSNGIEVVKSYPVVVNAGELTKQQHIDLEAFIAKNIKFLQTNFYRYALILPINGKYVLQGVIAARNAETSAEEKVQFFETVKNVSAGLVAEEGLNELIFEVNNKYFLANASRTKVSVKLSFTTTGNFIIKIGDKEITITKEEVQNTKDYFELITKIQAHINNEETKDKEFKQLNVIFDEQSLKQQVPTDSKVDSLAAVEDKLKVATSKGVFQNYTIHFIPIGAEKTGQKIPNPPISPDVTTILPPELRGAKPRYGLFELSFESDIDRAAYIVRDRNKRSKHDAEYLRFVMKATGFKEEEVRALGIQILDQIKTQAKDAPDGTNLSIGKVYAPKTIADPTIELQQKQKEELEAAELEALNLDYIADDTILDKTIKDYPATDKDGNTIKTDLSVKRIQTDIQKEADNLKNIINCINAA